MINNIVSKTKQNETNPYSPIEWLDNESQDTKFQK